MRSLKISPKGRARALLTLAGLFWALLDSRSASAGEAGLEDAGVACDGSLCDTTDGSTCGLSRPGAVDAPIGSTTAGAFVALTLMLARRVRHRRLAQRQ
jgi:hypothetical protein